jgi:ABC-type cobalamin/Fe3+-siderophores transport system ATPase subunit
MDLIIDALSVKLGKRTVLHDVSAHLRPGRVTAILGPNGAGKSTLIKAAATLVDRSGGDVRLDMQDVATMDRAPAPARSATSRRTRRSTGTSSRATSLRWAACRISALMPRLLRSTTPQ